MKSADAMLHLLEGRRREAHDNLGHRPIGVACCEVLDELIRRVRAVNDQSPTEPLTLSGIQRMPDVINAIQSALATVNTMGELMNEGGQAVEQRRRPFLRFVARIESEGFEVADCLTVTDVTHWADLDVARGDPAIQVQLAAEEIARAEQANIYQQRVERMASEIGQTEDEYAQRIRNLTAETDT